MSKPRESLHFSCCFCGKDMPNAKKLPVDFAIVCLTCRIELLRLKRKQETAA
ncbi:hypothetical protein GX563_08520 [Candidatus Bathyarchaeota archaeon]|nr:hypothetical protein [Candidatus Bathyarchaeota archaeon]